jgi:acyl-[acyl-carrier-protein] desaturase
LSIHTNKYEAHFDILHSLQDIVSENLNYLAPVDRAWQPTDYLPDLAADNWQRQVQDFRVPAQCLSDEALVVLVGDMVTEEALPSYSASLNLIARDYEGTNPKPWAKWMRGWSAEENRHGDLLNAYLRLTGRVDMRSVEQTIHHLIANGFNPQAYPDPYNGLIYTSFQERATRISHCNVARIAAAQGDPNLAKICLRISGDEARHEAFYTLMAGKVMEADPEGGILAFREMMRGLIAMPGRLMYDGKDADLFDHFAIVAQRLGVYTVHHYAEIIEHLIKTWAIASHSVCGAAARAQDYLCRQAERYLGYADLIADHQRRIPPATFSWIQGRAV